MITSDNTTVKIPCGDDRVTIAKVREYKKWLYDHNIKYTMVHWPEWHSYPSGINMRNEDALFFKLTFNL